MRNETYFQVVTKSGEFYTSVEFDINDSEEAEFLKSLVELIQQKDKMNNGHLTFYTLNDALIVLPLSDVAHIRVFGVKELIE